MKNDNCLKGMMCPKCGQAESFDVDVLSTATLMDEGVVEYTGAKFDGGHTAGCTQCDWTGTVSQLSIPGFSVTFEIYTPLSLEMGEADRRGWWMPGEWLHDDYPGELAFEFDPDDFDPEEHETVDDAVVEWALFVLRDEGAIHPNEDPSDDARWWSTEDEVHRFDTGAQIAKSFHFAGFTPEARQRINQELSA